MGHGPWATGHGRCRRAVAEPWQSRGSLGGTSRGGSGARAVATDGRSRGGRDCCLRISPQKMGTPGKAGRSFPSRRRGRPSTRWSKPGPAVSAQGTGDSSAAVAATATARRHGLPTPPAPRPVPRPPPQPPQLAPTASRNSFLLCCHPCRQCTLFEGCRGCRGCRGFCNSRGRTAASAIIHGPWPIIHGPWTMIPGP